MLLTQGLDVWARHDDLTIEMSDWPCIQRKVEGTIRRWEECVRLYLCFVIWRQASLITVACHSQLVFQAPRGKRAPRVE